MINSSFIENFIKGRDMAYNVEIRFFGVVVYCGVLRASDQTDLENGIRYFFDQNCGLRYPSPAWGTIIELI